MTTPEVLRTNPSVSPASAPSDTLLRNFRATLDTRWGEFDQATMKEAESQAWFFGAFVNVGEKRNEDADFRKAKLAFDEAKAMLATVSNDSELKASAAVLGKVEETLRSLTGYLASIKPEEKAKSHNIILAKTTADLASFKAEITGKATDRREAEVAVAAEKSIPRPAVTAAWAAASIPFISSAEAREVTWEVTGEIKKALGPWGMIFKWVKDVSTKEVAIQIKDLAKEYTETKWTENPLDKFFAMIKLFFLRWQVRRSGMDLSKDMTAEEMKMAGIVGVSSQATRGSSNDKLKEAGDTALIRVWFKGFARTFIQPVIDTTGSKKYFSYADIDSLITVEKFRNMPFQKLVDCYAKYKASPDKKGLKNDLWIADDKIDPELLFFVVERLSTWKWKAYIDKHAVPSEDADMTIGWVFSRLHKNMHLAEKFDSLKPTKPITWPGDLGDFFSEIGTKLDMPLDNPSALLSHLDYKSSLTHLGIESSMLGYVVSNKNKNISEISPNTILEADISNEAWKESMKKVLDFWWKFQNTISEKFSFGFSSEYKSFFSKNGATLWDVFRLYVITGWDSNYESLNPAQQAYIYMKLWWMFSKDQAFRWEYFNRPLVSAFFEAETNFKIPLEVKNLIWTLFNSAVETSLDKVGGFITELWNTLDTKQKAIFISSLWAWVVLLWYLRPLRWIGMWIAWTVLAASAGVAVAAMWPDTKKVSIWNTQYNRDDLPKKIASEIGKIGL